MTEKNTVSVLKVMESILRRIKSEVPFNVINLKKLNIVFLDHTSYFTHSGGIQNH